MRKLSLREKILIYIMILLLAFVVGYYLIMKPTEAILSQAQMDQTSAQMGHEQLSKRVDSLETRQASYNTALAYYDEHKDDYPDSENSWSIERDVMKYLASHNLVPESDGISISDTELLAAPISETTYSNEEDATDASMGLTTADMTAQANSSNTQADTTTLGGVYVNSCHINCRGTWQDFEGLLKEAYDNPLIHIQSYSMSDTDLPQEMMFRDISYTDINYSYDLIITYMTSAEGVPAQQK